MMLVEFKDYSMRYRIFFKAIDIESNNPKKKYEKNDSSPSWKIFVENTVCFDTFSRVSQNYNEHS